MGLEEKKQIVKEVIDKIDKASCVCFTNYKGLSASRMNELRRNLASNNAEMKVFKNRLILRALKEKSLEELTHFVDGPMAIVFAYENPLQSIKIIYDFSKEDKKPLVNGGYIDGDIFDAQSFLELASLPTKEDMYRQMLNSLSSPLFKMVYLISGIPMKLLSVLSLVLKKKEE